MEDEMTREQRARMEAIASMSRQEYCRYLDETQAADLRAAAARMAGRSEANLTMLTRSDEPSIVRAMHDETRHYYGIGPRAADVLLQCAAASVELKPYGSLDANANVGDEYEPPRSYDLALAKRREAKR